MNQKGREIGGRILHYQEGLGTVTRKMIEDRAREIALIRGRRRPTREDRLDARRELLQMSGIDEEKDRIDDRLDSLDPSETPARHGRQAPTFEPEDEELVQRRLVEQGIEEADHEQMVEGHRASREDDLGEEERRRKAG